MAKGAEKTPVKGGWVKRNVETGGFLATGSSSGASKVSVVSERSVHAVSSKRSSALKRLADR